MSDYSDLMQTFMKKKRPMGRPRKNWEVQVKSDVQKVKPGESW